MCSGFGKIRQKGLVFVAREFFLTDRMSNVTLHRILMLKVKARARHAFTLKQKNLF